MNTPDYKYALIGFLRALGFTVLATVLHFLGDAANLAFLEGPWPLLISGIALSIEHAIEANTGKALFGAMKA